MPLGMPPPEGGTLCGGRGHPNASSENNVAIQGAHICPRTSQGKTSTLLKPPPMIKVWATQLRTPSGVREQGTYTPPVEQSQSGGPPGAALKPASAQQPPIGVNTAEGLGFRPLSFRYWDPLVIPWLQTSIVSYRDTGV